MKKKIAFIEEGFLGSTLPLVKEFCKAGYAVDIYYLRKDIHEPEGCRCSYKATHKGINLIPDEQLSEIRDYIGDTGNYFKMYLVYLTRPYESVPFVRIFADCIIGLECRKIAKYIDTKNYEFINIVVNYNMHRFTHLLSAIKTKTVLSLHEVWNHHSPSNVPSRIISKAIKKGTDIVVYSDKSYNDIQHLDGIDMSHVHKIPFGLFDSYSSLLPKAPTESLPEKYFLFFGYILPYKGLSILHEAVKMLKEKLKDYKIVIAGKGNDPALEQMRKNSTYTILQRFIKNDELCHIIKKADAVICPYTSMSQSGIPQTAFVFNTPVIASDLEGFKEIITPDNGKLFPTGDAAALAKAIEHFITDTSVSQQMTDNIKNFYTMHPYFSWERIMPEYEKRFIK